MIHWGANTCIRLFPRSFVYDCYPHQQLIYFLKKSAAKPAGLLNSPSPVPGVPHFDIKLSIAVKLLYTVIFSEITNIYVITRIHGYPTWRYKLAFTQARRSP